jgi:hypothetical protein
MSGLLRSSPATGGRCWALASRLGSPSSGKVAILTGHGGPVLEPVRLYGCGGLERVAILTGHGGPVLA